MARPRKNPLPDAVKPPAATPAAPAAPKAPAAVSDPTPEPDFKGQDHYSKPVKVNISLRSNVENYLEELQERLKDLEDNKQRTIYEIPLKISGTIYAMLLKDAIRRAKKNPNWNERDHLEMLIQLRDAGVLTPSGKKA